MENEIWKNIEGYEELYEVSNFGRVKSLKGGRWGTGKERILKPQTDGCGYLKVHLCNEGKVKTFKVHRLVAQAFIPNPQNLPEINHINEDKTNNRVENLEWCTREYNNNHGTRNQRVAKSNTNGKKSKRVLCVESGIVYPSSHEVQRKFGYSQGNISSCCTGRHKQAYGYTWKYVD